MNKEYDEGGVKPVTSLPENKKDTKSQSGRIDYSDVNTEKGSLDRIGSLSANHYTDLQRKAESMEVESVTPPSPSKNQKDALGKESTAEYSDLFEERRSALTTKLPSEIELEEKSNKELDEGGAKSVTPLPKYKKDTEGIDYSQGTTAREGLLTEVGFYLADDYTALKIKNDNLIKLLNKLTFPMIV